METMMMMLINYKVLKLQHLILGASATSEWDDCWSSSKPFFTHSSPVTSGIVHILIEEYRGHGTVERPQRLWRRIGRL